MASTYLERTQSGTETDSKKATISVWVKLGNHTGNFNAGVFGTHVSGNFSANGNSQIGFYNGGLYAWFKDGGSTYYKQESTKRFIDHNAWYHLVYRFDTTQSAGADRIRIYVNGEEITSFASSSGPPQNTNIQMNNGGRIVRVGTYNFTAGGHNYLDGCMSHFHFCDGYSYGPDSFGSTDATTGEWKINASPNVQYGTNGFLILKDGNTITDQSPNSNNFAVGGGTLTKTEDCPSNIFAVLDSNNITLNGTSTYATGNTKFKNSSGNWGSAISTLMPTSGKWYFESQVTDNNGQKFMMGICDMDKYPEWRWQTYPYYGYRGYCYYGDGKFIGTNSSGGTNADLSTSLATTNNNDYIGMAVDLDNNKLYTHINGTYVTYNSYVQNPNSGSYGLDISYGRATNGTVAFGISTRDNYNMYVNFGNGSFNGTTLTGTTYQDSNSRGIFKYQPPTNFLALCTNNLN